MTEFFQTYKHLFGWIALGSMVIVVVSLFLVPWAVARIPADYFASEERPPSKFAGRHPAIRLSVYIVRNLFALLLVLAGIVMLFIPGQGLLTIIAGALLLDYPGKHRLERRIVRSQSVWKSINWLRKKAKVPPLIRPDGMPEDAPSKIA